MKREWLSHNVFLEASSDINRGSYEELYLTWNAKVHC